jgi:hypothetical protein
VFTLLHWQVPAIVAESAHLEPAIRLSEKMAQQVEERGAVGATRKAHQKGWVLDMEKLLRLDERSPEQVVKVLDWLHHGRDDVSSFWQVNVLCPGKLRLRWDQMRMQYERLRRRQAGGRRSGLAEATGADVIIDRLLAR